MNTKKLEKILSLLMVAVEKKAVVSQYDHYVFYNKAISTFNGRIFISHPVELDLDCSVVADDLLNIIKTVDDEEVKLTLKDGKLYIKSEDVSAELSTDVYEDKVVQTIKTLDVASFNWKKNGKEVSKDFIEGLNDCRFSVSKDASCQYNSNCIHIVDNAVESTDRFRATEYLMEDSMEEMLIPSSSVNALISFDPTLYIKDQGWVHFRDEDGVIFSVAIVEGVFPDVALMLESGTPEVEITLPVQISNVLSEFGKLSSGETEVFKSMEISIADEKVTCRTEKLGCYVKKTIPFPGMKKKVTFNISPTLLNSVLAKTNTIGINHTNMVASFKTEVFSHVVVMPQVEEENLGEASLSTGDDVPF